MIRHTVLPRAHLKTFYNVSYIYSLVNSVEKSEFARVREFALLYMCSGGLKSAWRVLLCATVNFSTSYGHSRRLKLGAQLNQTEPKFEENNLFLSNHLTLHHIRFLACRLFRSNHLIIKVVVIA